MHLWLHLIETINVACVGDTDYHGTGTAGQNVSTASVVGPGM